MFAELCQTVKKNFFLYLRSCYYCAFCKIPEKQYSDSQNSSPPRSFGRLFSLYFNVCFKILSILLNNPRVSQPPPPPSKKKDMSGEKINFVKTSSKY